MHFNVDSRSRKLCNLNIAVLCLEPTGKCSRTLPVTESFPQCELPLSSVIFLRSLHWWPLNAFWLSLQQPHNILHQQQYLHISPVQYKQFSHPLLPVSLTYESQDSFLLRPHHTVSTMMKLLKPLNDSSLSFSLKTDSLIALVAVINFF